MNWLAEKRKNKMYRSDINIIGSIPDINFIFDIIRLHAENKSQDRVHKIINEQNIHNIRTIKSRKRFLNGVEKVFIKFKTKEHQELFYSLFRHQELFDIKKYAVLFQFLINDDLFFNLTDNVYIKLFQQGRLNINKDELSSYLFAIRENDSDMKKWSEETVETVASKYLTFMKRIGFLKGKIKKEYVNTSPNQNIIIFILYLLKSIQENQNLSLNLNSNKFIKFMMISEETIINSLKKAGMKRYLTYISSGKDVKLDTKLSYKEIVNELASGF